MSSDEKSESKKVSRKDKDKYTDIGAQADARVSGSPSKMTESEKAKILDKLNEISQMQGEANTPLDVKTLKDNCPCPAQGTGSSGPQCPTTQPQLGCKSNCNNPDKHCPK